MPRDFAIAAALALLALLAVSAARAQEATERYIPLGESPGLSGTEATFVGRIEAIDAETRTLRVAGEREVRTVGLDERTRIWLDRTALEKPNVPATLADCRAGQTAEIKYRDAEGARVADWIKVRVAAPSR